MQRCIEIKARKAISHEKCAGIPIAKRTIELLIDFVSIALLHDGSAHFRSANTIVSDADNVDDDEVISIAATVVRIYYALQIDNAASTVALTLCLPPMPCVRFKVCQQISRVILIEITILI